MTLFYFFKWKTTSIFFNGELITNPYQDFLRLIILIIKAVIDQIKILLIIKFQTHYRLIARQDLSRKFFVNLEIVFHFCLQIVCINCSFIYCWTISTPSTLGSYVFHFQFPMSHKQMDGPKTSSYQTL